LNAIHSFACENQHIGDADSLTVTCVTLHRDSDHIAARPIRRKLHCTRRAIMLQDERNLLDLLKAELNFLKKGGYGRSPREPRRAQLIFEDSPSCMNYDSKENPSPCAECALIQFVPEEKRAERIPCRHIPLTREGETLQDLYRGGTQQELEDAMAGWLRGNIARLESEQAQDTPAIGSGPVKKTPAPVVH
jgi:hypothetical protein